MKEVKAKASRKGGKRGCLCKDNTYSKECCDGSLLAQGVGAFEGHHASTVTNTNEPRTMVRSV